jgi:hypothetical protein
LTTKLSELGHSLLSRTSLPVPLTYSRAAHERQRGRNNFSAADEPERIGSSKPAAVHVIAVIAVAWLPWG